MFNEKEQEIIKYGLENGKSKDEVIKAISNYRLGVTSEQTNSSEQVKEEKPNYFQIIGNSLKTTATEFTDQAKKALTPPEVVENNPMQTGKNILSRAIDVPEAALRFVGGVAKTVLSPIAEIPIVKNSLEKIGGVIGKIPGIDYVVNKAGELSQQYPEASKDIQNIIDIATVAGTGLAETPAKEALSKGTELGVKGAKKLGEEAVDTATDIANNAKKMIGMGEKTAEEKAIEAITPNIKQLSTIEKKELLDAGKLTPETKLKPAQVVLDQEEKAFAAKNADLLQGKTAIENYTNISNRVSEMDASVGSYLKDQNLVFSKPKLKAKIIDGIDKIAKPVQVTEDSWKKATEQLVNDFMNSINKSQTIYDLWEARKTFDRTLENVMNAFEGTPTAKKALGRAIRNNAQEFIESYVGDGVYKSAMQDMSKLIDVNEIIGNKAIKEMGNSGVQNWLKKNPLQAKAVRTMGGLLKLGTVFEVVK